MLESLSLRDYQYVKSVNSFRRRRFGSLPARKKEERRCNQESGRGRFSKQSWHTKLAY